MMFRKPTLADIYVRELAQVGATLIPMYPPNAPEVRVGTVGRFSAGEWERRGHLDERLGGKRAFAEAVPLTSPTPPAAFAFASEGGVALSAAGSVTVLGTELLQATLSFTRDRAVVASFRDVVLRGVKRPRDLDRLLWQLYYDGRLAADEVVVAAHQSAASGTVIVNRKGGVTLEVLVDPALAGGVVSLEGLGAGVTFGSGSQASAQLTGRGFTVAVELKGLAPDDVNRITQVRNFAPSAERLEEQFEGMSVPDVPAAALLAGADFSRPEA